jgi:membrane-bound lytic murein transglycosylase B
MRGIAAIALALLLSACSSSAGDQVLGTRATSPAPTPSPGQDPEPTDDPLIAFPSPNHPVPSRAKALASEIRKNESKLETAIRMWLDRGGVRKSRSGHRVALGALWQQRIFRKLTKQPRLARSTIARLPKAIARKVEAHVEAGAGLRALASPIEPPVHMRITPVDRHDILASAYMRAGRRYDIPVEILASLNFVESKFGRFMGPSSAGAKGPMQFIPSTWDIYGEGNIWDPRDAIMAAARYLSASGAPGDMNGALFAYNHSDAYVKAIRTYAAEIEKRRHSFYAYYFWQVFVRTTEGDVQLTGPGRDQ